MNDSASVDPPTRSFLAITKLLRPSFWLVGNWKKALKKSNLPADVEATIYQVVQRSRLMRREKYDVAEDLIHHFQDGNQQGTSFEALTERFGDPVSAALLIRRSKIRNRSILVSAIRMIPLVSLCFSIAYMALFLWFHSGQANPTVDYLAELNHNVTRASAEDKAWPVYRSMWSKYQLGDGAKGKYVDMRQQMYAPTEGSNEYHIVGPSDPQWPQAIEMLKQHQGMLDAFRQGATRKVFGLTLQADVRQYSDEDFAAFYPDEKKDTFKGYGELQGTHDILDGATICLQFPHFYKTLTAARMFHIDTRYAAVEGDSDRATENIQTVLGLANQLADNKIVTSSLIARAISRVGFDQLEEVVNNNPDFLSLTQLEKLQARLEQLDVHAWLDYSADKPGLKDMVQRCYTDDGNGDGRLTAAGMQVLSSGVLTGTASNDFSFWRILSDSKSNFAQSALFPTSLLMCAGRKETLAKMEELFSELEADRQLPFWESRNSKADGWQHHEDFYNANRHKHILLSKLFPSLPHIRNSIEHTQVRRNAIILALAMHRFHRQHDRWPKAAAELVGIYIEEFPVDIINGQPLRFKIVDDEPLIYSVGMDHDDDGGADAKLNGAPIPRRNIFLGPKDDNFEGDWILWPTNA